MTITEALNDLQNILKQQNSIYETNQNLHFDWLKSVLFQLDVYDQSQTREIKVNESESQTDLEKIKYNYNMQQQNVLNNCKKQIQHMSKLESCQKRSAKKKKIKRKYDGNSSCAQKKFHEENSSPNSCIKAAPRPRKRTNRLQVKAASISFIKTPFDLNQNMQKEQKSKGEKNNKKDHKDKKVEILSPNSHKVKFIDNDSLLSVSSSCSDFCIDEDNHNIKDEENQMRLCQSLPSKSNLLTISSNYKELTQSVSSFQEKWQEMVEEKKRSSLMPKVPVGSLFNFDDAPDSYQITGSEDDYESFIFSDDDDEIHEEDPLEIHGKMIPVWARKEKVEEQLKSQQSINPDDVFTGMPKHCQISQIFDDNQQDDVQMSILAQGHMDESDNYDELMAVQ